MQLQCGIFSLFSGVNVMIKIFCDFRQFSAKKLVFFTKNQCHDPNFSKTSSNLNKKPPFFSPKFLAKFKKKK
jgi:hypothetical protein